jgi:hypothetical protein
MFADDIPSVWILATLLYCDRFPNCYLFQSKNPARIYRKERLLPANSVICTTIETNRIYEQIMGDSPIPEDRAIAMRKFSQVRYVTIEPIMDFDLEDMVELIKMCEPEQVNIGADSKGHGLPEPQPGKIESLVTELEKFTTIHRKSNLKRLW